MSFSLSQYQAAPLTFGWWEARQQVAVLWDDDDAIDVAPECSPESGAVQILTFI